LWNAPDFIAQLTQFIPPWGVRYVHYYGLYSSRCKARWQHWPTSRGSPRRPGRTRIPSNCLPTSDTQMHRPYRSPPVAQHGRG
jgi:hypothetical protein